MMHPLLKKFVEIFNAGEYFDAHEVLEELWIETDDDSKNFYKGLIQCAVALVHYERGNMRGALKVCRTGCGYLNSYMPDYQDINTEALVEQMEDFFQNPGGPFPQIEIIDR